jgi:hypothetical protein
MVPGSGHTQSQVIAKLSSKTAIPHRKRNALGHWVALVFLGIPR